MKADLNITVTVDIPDEIEGEDFETAIVAIVEATRSRVKRIKNVFRDSGSAFQINVLDVSFTDIIRAD